MCIRDRAKYYRATSGDKNKAVMLYFANMKIAQAFHPLLSSFEVILDVYKRQK